MSLTLSNIEQARRRIAPYVVQTPLLRLQNLDQYLGCRVYAKAECMQITGAFKVRGAMNKFLSLSQEQRDRGLVAVSSGNHGKGIAYTAKKFGAKLTVVMPETAPPVKIQAIRDLGAQVVLCYAPQRYQIGAQLCEQYGYTMIPPFDDYDIMAGQGTIGLELMEQCPELDCIIVPVSGGGLIGGIAAAVKSLAPEKRIIGVEPAAMPCYSKSMEAGQPVTVPYQPSVADALLSLTPGQKNFPIVQEYVERCIPVSDEALLKGMKLLLLEGKLLAEPSSCIGVGALLQGLIPVQPSDKVCLIVSGGSVSLEQLKQLEDVTL